MEHPIVRFAEMPWIEIAPGAREKKFRSASQVLRLLELAPGFEETEWCLRQHFGIVAEGAFSIQFSNRTMHYTKGDGISIAAGEKSKHRALVSETPVTLFLVEFDQTE